MTRYDGADPMSHLFTQRRLFSVGQFLVEAQIKVSNHKQHGYSRRKPGIGQEIHK